MSPQQKAAAEAGDFVIKFNDIILYPTIALLTAVAFLIFLWGCFEYLINANNDSERQRGVKHITFGIIGLVIMVSAYSILKLVLVGLALDDELKCANEPTGPGCESAFMIPSKTGGPTPGNPGGGPAPANPGGGPTPGNP